jgi:hypothetical protein
LVKISSQLVVKNQSISQLFVQTSKIKVVSPEKIQSNGTDSEVVTRLSKN